MKDREYIIKLYDLYKDLLTSKQQEYFELYYYDDLSLSEISDNLKVSKTLVSKTLSNVNTKIEKYEKKIKLLEIYTYISNIKDEKIKRDLENIIYKEN